MAARFGSAATRQSARTTRTPTPSGWSAVSAGAGDDTLVGLALGGGCSNFDLSDGLGDGHANTFNAGLFARQGFGDAYVAGAPPTASTTSRPSRSVVGDTLNGDFDAHSLLGSRRGGLSASTRRS